MDAPTEQLFERLKSNDDTVQNHALAELAMLLEKSSHPERNEEVWKIILPEDLMEMCLSAQEIKVAVKRAIKLVESKTLPRGSMMSLIYIIAFNGQIDDAEALLQFYSEFFETFNEQEAFSFTASLGLFFQRIKDVQHIYPVLVKYNTIKLLQAFQTDPSKRMQESARRWLNFLRKNGINVD